MMILWNALLFATFGALFFLPLIMRSFTPAKALARKGEAE